MQKGDYVKVVDDYSGWTPQESGRSKIYNIRGCRFQIHNILGKRIEYRSRDFNGNIFNSNIPIDHVKQISKEEFENPLLFFFIKSLPYVGLMSILASLPLISFSRLTELTMNFLNDPIVMNSIVGLFAVLCTCIGGLAVNFSVGKFFQGLGRLADRHRRIKAAKAEAKANAELKQIEAITQRLAPSPLSQMEAVATASKLEPGKWARVKEGVSGGGTHGASVNGRPMKAGDFVQIEKIWGGDKVEIYSGKSTQTIILSELEPI